MTTTITSQSSHDHHHHISVVAVPSHWQHVSTRLEGGAWCIYYSQGQFLVWLLRTLTPVHLPRVFVVYSRGFVGKCVHHVCIPRARTCTRTRTASRRTRTFMRAGRIAGTTFPRSRSGSLTAPTWFVPQHCQHRTQHTPTRPAQNTAHPTQHTVTYRYIPCIFAKAFASAGIGTRPFPSSCAPQWEGNMLARSSHSF